MADAARKTVLVVAADDAVRDRAVAALRGEFRVLRAASAEAALTMLERDRAELVVAEAHLPGISGLDLLRILRENHPLAEVVMLAADDDLDTAVEAARRGAYHVLGRGVSDVALRAMLAHASERQDLTRRVLALSTDADEPAGRGLVTGPSPAMRALMDEVRKVAPLPASVLLLGESGTGKELVARLLHRLSGRADAPFVAVNLAAIPRDLVESTLFGHEKGSFTGAVRRQVGRFELAQGGTLFLDEIGDLALELQAKLLRAIQEGEIERVGGEAPIRVGFRLVCATHVDLARAVREGRFRDDLYYRINVVPLRLPALRERLEDLPALADAFLRRAAERFGREMEGIDPSALETLARHTWPGNVRELEHLIERLVATADQPWISEADLPVELQLPALQDGGDGTNQLERAMAAFERTFLMRALERHSWNVTGTARALGIPLSTLKFRMDRLDIRAVARRFRAP